VDRPRIYREFITCESMQLVFTLFEPAMY